MTERDHGRCPAGGRHRPLLLILAVGALLAACSPRPVPSESASPSSPSIPPSPTANPTGSASVSPTPPDDRLVVLVRSDAGARLLTWRNGAPVDLPLPGADAHELAVDGTGRAAVVAGGEVYIAESLTDSEVRWTPIPGFRPDPGFIVTGLAWSPDGALAWTGAREIAGDTFTVVAGPIGEAPVRIEAEAGLNGAPVWLDADRIGIPAVRGSTNFLTVVSVRARQVSLTPFELGGLAVSYPLGLVAVSDVGAATVELLRLNGLMTATEPDAVIKGPDEEWIAEGLAFSADGGRLEVTWFKGGRVVVSLYDGAAGWRESTRLGLADLGLPNIDTSDASVEVAWRP